MNGPQPDGGVAPPPEALPESLLGLCRDLDPALDRLDPARAEGLPRHLDWRAGAVDLLGWFERAHDAAPGEQALLCGAVCDRRDAASPRGVPLREHLLALVARMGWRVVAGQEVGAELAAWAARLRAVLGAHRDELWRRGYDVERAEQALAAILQPAGGRPQPALRLRIERVEAAGAPRIVRVDASRGDAMRRLFADIFGHAMTAEHRHWKYGGGRGRAVGIEADGELLAHYGGVARRIWQGERSLRACQICDVMVSPRVLRSLARQGPIFKVAATFFETEVGWALPHDISFGFPSERHHEIGVRLGLYAPIDRIVRCTWPACAQPQADPPQADLLRPLPPLDGRDRGPRAVVDRLWLAMRGDLPDRWLGQRDADWLHWRYAQRPGVEYALTLVEGPSWRQARGLIVTRPADEALDLIDLVGRPSQFGALVLAARRLAAQQGRPRLRAWISKSQQALLMQDSNPVPEVEDLQIPVPCGIRSPGRPPSEFAGRWLLMAGDADFT